MSTFTAMRILDEARRTRATPISVEWENADLTVLPDGREMFEVTGTLHVGGVSIQGVRVVTDRLVLDSLDLLYSTCLECAAVPDDRDYCTFCN